MNLSPKLLRTVSIVFAGLFLAVILAGVAAYLYIAPQVPSIETLKDARLQVPLRVYSREGNLIAEFGEMKRTPLHYADIPPQVIQAVLAAEDDRFFEHPGVDYQGLLRAAWHLLRTGEKGQGGSTITMQVARNFFLSSEKTYLRKFTEILLALKIDRELSKEEILELYLNKIYLGNRAYGVAAAAQTYYGKNITELELAEIAMIAGLPKAPSTYNPVVDPERAVQRRNYVIGRMQTLGFVDAQTAELARNAPETARLHTQSADVEAPYVAEMVRGAIVARFGEEAAYTSGYRVFTTIDSNLQQTANKALSEALLDYDRRHGYRGPEARVSVGSEPEDWQAALQDYRPAGGLIPALVVKVEDKRALVYLGEGDPVPLEWDALEWAKRYINDDRVGDPPQKAADVVRVGDIIRLEPVIQGYRLAQVPQVEGALVSLRPQDGALLALVGGFDFYASNYNRVIQAQRQPGSAFKPFVYSAALDKGFTPATIINDAPVVFQDTELEGAWRPENYSGKFYGPTRLREALVQSRNLVSIRLLRSIGLGYALAYSSRFGFDGSRLPHDLSLALGSGSVTPMELVRGYAAFANGGFRVEPYFIERIESADGQVLFQTEPARACPTCEIEAQAADSSAQAATAPMQPTGPNLAPRVIDSRNAYLMTSMMQDVIQRGTARRATELGRSDVAGKTGTTNDQRDAWFCGFNADVVATTWVGFDTPRPLGAGETGAGAALPIWVDFMREALRSSPERPARQPSGLVTVRINPETGLAAAPKDANAIFEMFYSENVPSSPGTSRTTPATSSEGTSVTEQLF